MFFHFLFQEKPSVGIVQALGRILVKALQRLLDVLAAIVPSRLTPLCTACYRIRETRKCAVLHERMQRDFLSTFSPSKWRIAFRIYR